ncbi:MAG: hypothetical protein NT004_11040 [Bacteroidetes bacterium]|nr:hypothetical protein [Bacteroidota bacterium]
MRDFTFEMYLKLIRQISATGYQFQTFEEFLLKPEHRVVILRHDCDIWPGNDLKMAGIEHDLNIKASYFFRIPHTFKINIIEKIRDLGHEIGYHYENLADTNGDYVKAIESFRKNLSILREIYPVKTVAMHGRPLSIFDSRLLWKKYKLEDFGLIGEPYLNVDYSKVCYLTDTGSRWDGNNVSIRDTVISKFNYSIRTTNQLIEHFKGDKLPEQILMNTHAARWNNNFSIWCYRFLLQKFKNTAKFVLKQIQN